VGSFFTLMHTANHAIFLIILPNLKKAIPWFGMFGFTTTAHEYCFNRKRTCHTRSD